MRWMSVPAAVVHFSKFLPVHQRETKSDVSLSCLVSFIKPFSFSDRKWINCVLSPFNQVCIFVELLTFPPFPRRHDSTGFRVKEGLSCVLSRTATSRKSTQPSPYLTRKPCTYVGKIISTPLHLSSSIPQQGNTAEIVLTVLHRNFLGVDEFLGLVSIPLRDFDVYERPKTKYTLPHNS